MDHTRHQGIFDVSRTSVGLIGAGGIGATTALALAKMGVRYIDIWDDDTVSDVNLPTQLHKIASLNRSKVTTLSETLAEFSDEVDTSVVFGRFTENSEYTGTVLISAVDSINARKAIWEAARRCQIRFYLDARMAAEEFHLFTVDMSSPETYAWYEQMLSGESEEGVPDLPCTSKATFYCAMLAAAHIAHAVKRIGMGQDVQHVLIQNLPQNSLTIL